MAVWGVLGAGFNGSLFLGPFQGSWGARPTGLRVGLGCSWFPGEGSHMLPQIRGLGAVLIALASDGGGGCFCSGGRLSGAGKSQGSVVVRGPARSGRVYWPDYGRRWSLSGRRMLCRGQWRWHPESHGGARGSKDTGRGKGEQCQKSQASGSQGSGFFSTEVEGSGGYSLHYPQEGPRKAIQEVSARGLLG